jgi:hypothetical protein
VANLVYLSDAWITALDEVAASHRGLQAAAVGSALVVEYRVASDPPALWHITLNQGKVRVKAGPAAEPDAWFEARPAAARALFDGNLDPLRAVIDGDLSMGGDPRRLLDHRKILDGIGDVFAGVRAATIPTDS